MYIYGASGHGKVIKEVLESQKVKVEGFIDDAPYIKELAGLPVIHSISNVDKVIIGIGDNATRKTVSNRIGCCFCEVAIHKDTIISPSARFEEGTVVMAGAIVNADAKIGKHCIINTGSIIDHECIIGDYSHVSPHATLCGDVKIGEGTWIGAGSVVIQGVKIGKWSLIGAGSVVVDDIPDGCLAYGNPCRVVRKLIKHFKNNI